jgi:hypothetical protein
MTEVIIIIIMVPCSLTTSRYMLGDRRDSSATAARSLIPIASRPPVKK